MGETQENISQAYLTTQNKIDMHKEINPMKKEHYYCLFFYFIFIIFFYLEGILW